MEKVQDYLTLSWGKARPEGEVAWHPAGYHCLDVGAVALVLLENSPHLRRLIERECGPRGVTTVVFFSVLHDLGKFASGFQALNQPLAASLRLGFRALRYGDQSTPYHHTSIGAGIWRSHVVPRLLLPRGWSDEEGAELLDYWMCAAVGHHGVPPHDDAVAGAAEATSARDIELALSFAADVISLILPEVDLGSGEYRMSAPTSERMAKLLSYPIAGLVSVADWIGSQQRWFPYTRPKLSLERYWREVALPRARAAVQEAGFEFTAMPTEEPTIAQLFPKLRRASPMQAAAAAARLADGPQLWIVEDGTGTGKTEASTLIAARMVAGGLATGIADGMPTTATADAMALRKLDLSTRLFGRPEAVAIVHGAKRRGRGVAGDAGSGDGASADASAWLHWDNRTALSARVVVGTVDQMLLGAMRAKFAVIRLFGTTGKVLVLDEVHSYDAYTGRLIEGLLQVHALLGGSAVLLSATLIAATKRGFAAAFLRGWQGRQARRLTDGEIAELGRPEYPLLTRVSAEGVEATPVPGAPAARRRVTYRIAEDVENEGVDLLRQAAAYGYCAAWIRNTVADVVNGAKLAQAAGLDPMVVHARFPAARLAEIRADLLRTFGPDSTPAQRRGRTVVASQYIEQSLDIDFDELATDLCPIEYLLQRAGRWRRHVRGLFGDPKRKRERRPRSSVLILGPDPLLMEPEDWVNRLSRGTRAIYKDVGVLWRTAKILSENGTSAYPSRIRPLVEGAIREVDDDLPAVLERRMRDRAETRAASMARAAQYLSALHDGYSRVGAAMPGEDDRTPTREGDDCRPVLLVRRDGEITPFDGADLASGRFSASTSFLEKAFVDYRGYRQRVIEDMPEHLAKACGFLDPVLVDGRTWHSELPPGGTGVRYDPHLGLVPIVDLRHPNAGRP